MSQHGPYGERQRAVESSAEGLDWTSSRPWPHWLRVSPASETGAASHISIEMHSRPPNNPKLTAKFLKGGAAPLFCVLLCGGGGRGIPPSRKQDLVPTLLPGQQPRPPALVAHSTVPRPRQLVTLLLWVSSSRAGLRGLSTQSLCSPPL